MGWTAYAGIGDGTRGKRSRANASKLGNTVPEDILKEPLKQQKELAGIGASRSPTHIRPRLELGARLSSSRPQSVAMKIAGHKNWIDLSARRDRV